MLNMTITRHPLLKRAIFSCLIALGTLMSVAQPLPVASASSQATGVVQQTTLTTNRQVEPRIQTPATPTPLIQVSAASRPVAVAPALAPALRARATVTRTNGLQLLKVGQPLRPGDTPLFTNPPLTATCTTYTITVSPTSGQPALSGDGSRVAFWSTGANGPNAVNPDGNIEVYLYDINKAQFTQVTSSTGSILGGFNLWPTMNYSGTLLSFSSDRDLVTGQNQDGNFELFVADISGSPSPTITQLTNTSVGVNTSPAMSGDGNHIAFSSNIDLIGSNPDKSTEIFMANISGTTLLHYTQVTSTPIGLVNDDPAINFDGSVVAYVGSTTVSSTVYIAKTNGGKPLAIGVSSLSVDNHPAISADGKTVVFVSDADIDTGQNISHTAQVFMYRVGGPITPTQITTVGNTNTRCAPAISGNALRVVCVSEDKNVFVYNTSDGAIQPLTSFGKNAEPAVNSDGQSIAYTRDGLLFVANCPVADVAASKSVSPVLSFQGQQVLYTVVVTNNGPGVADNVVLSDMLQGGILLAPAFQPNQDYLTKSDFDLGSYNNTIYTIGSGGQGSRAGELQQNVASMNAWELPDNRSTSSWTDMSQNAMLLHLNGSAPALDTSGNQFNAYCIICPAPTSGRLVNDLNFNGVTQYSYVLPVTALNYPINHDFTVMAWIRPAQTQIDTTLVDNSIIEKWDGNGGYPFVIRLWNQTSSSPGKVYAARYDTIYAPVVQSNVRVDDGHYHHVVFTRRPNPNDSNKAYLYLYIDGVQQTPPQLDYTGYAGGDTQNNSPVYLGERGSGSNHYAGEIDEVAVFDAGMSDAQVQQIYTRQSNAGRYAGYYDSHQMYAGQSVNWNLLNWTQNAYQVELADNQVVSGNIMLLHLNEPAGASFPLDTSGNGDTFSCSSCPTFGVPGKFNTAARFTAGQHLDAGYKYNLNNSVNELTLEAWVNLDDASVNQKIMGDTPIGKGYLLGVVNHQIYTEMWDFPNGTDHVIQAGFIPSGQWTHLAVTWSAANGRYRAYVNGNLVHEESNSNLQIYWPDTNSGTNHPVFRVGVAPWDGGTFAMSGSLDEAAVYNTELQPADILNHFLNGSSRLQFQVRSCGAPCNTENFIGPDGTQNSYFATLTATNLLTPSFNLTVTPNSYFQFRTYFNSDSQATATSPQVYTVTVRPLHGAVASSQGDCGITNPINCNLGTLTKGMTATVTIHAQVGTTAPSGFLGNMALATSDAADLVASNNLASVSTFVQQNVTLSITKQVTPTKPLFGQLMTYTIIVRNVGTSIAHDLTIQDQLPAGFTGFPPSANGITCNYQVGVGSQLLVCPNGTLGGNSNITVTIVGKTPANNIGSLSNTATVTAAEYLTVTSATAPAKVPVSVDIGVLQETNLQTATAGSPLVYKLTVTNSNKSQAPNVVLTDTLDPQVSFVDATPGCVDNSGVVVCTLQPLLSAPASVPLTVAVTVLPNTVLTVTNVLSLGTSGVPVTPANLFNTMSTPVQTRSHLKITKTALGACGTLGNMACAGGIITYTISFDSIGPSDAQGVSITDQLPARVTYVQQHIGGFTDTYNPRTGTITWYTSTLPGGTSPTIVFTVTVANFNPPSSLTNAVTATSTTTDPNPNGDNVSSVTIGVVANALTDVLLEVPLTCQIGVGCVFTATAVPANATLPVSFTWMVDDNVTVTVSVPGISNALVYTFTTGGSKNVSVVVNNPAGHPIQPPFRTVLVPEAELSIAKSGPTSAHARDTITYTIDITNAGPTDAANVTVTDFIPLPMLPSAVLTTTCSPACLGPFTQISNLGPTRYYIVWNLGTLPSAAGLNTQQLQYSLVITDINPPASITNVATITSSTTELTPTHNTSNFTTTVTPVAVQSVSVVQDPLAPCSPLTHQLNCQFVATVTPASATFPLTYTWRTTGGTIITSVPPGSNSTRDTETAGFTVSGTQTVTVTVNGSLGSSVSGFTTISVTVP
jgi:uncharacterized repeat protein (TIGR01451 family)